MRHQTLTGRLKDRLLLLLTSIFRTYSSLFHRPPVKDRYQLANAEFHLSIAELKRLIAATICPRDRLLIQLMVETGMRRCEVAALSAPDIDVTRSLIMIRNGKGKKTRFVPVNPGLALSLRSLGQSANGSVFQSRKGGPLTCRQINRIAAGAGKRANVMNPNPKYKSVTCHLLRHTFARYWKACGGSIETLSKILGHSSVKTTWDQYGTESLIDIQRNYRSTLKKMFSTMSISKSEVGQHEA